MKKVTLNIVDDRRFMDAFHESDYCPGIFFDGLPRSKKGLMTRHCEKYEMCDDCWNDAFDKLIGEEKDEKDKA